MRKITRQDLLDELEDGATILRKPAPFVPSINHEALDRLTEQLKALSEAQLAMVESFTKQLKALAQTEHRKQPTKLHITTWRDSDDNLCGDVEVTEYKE